MQLAHMLFLSVCFTLYYHTHLLQLLHSAANVSEQITLTGFWGCPWVGEEGTTVVQGFGFKRFKGKINGVERDR